MGHKWDHILSHSLFTIRKMGIVICKCVCNLTCYPDTPRKTSGLSVGYSVVAALHLASVDFSGLGGLTKKEVELMSAPWFVTGWHGSLICRVGRLYTGLCSTLYLG